MAAEDLPFPTVSIDVTEAVVPPNQKPDGSNQLKEFISSKQVINIPLISGVNVKELNFSKEIRIKKKTTGQNIAVM